MLVGLLSVTVPRGRENKCMCEEQPWHCQRATNSHPSFSLEPAGGLREHKSTVKT